MMCHIFVFLILFGFIGIVRLQTVNITAHKEKILRLHNGYRSVLSASNMKKLVWDGPLAKEAELVAKNCYIGPNQIRYGENMFHMETPIISDSELVSKAINTWYSEGAAWTLSTTCGEACRYTQMVWANSKKIGCAAHRCVQMKLVEEFMHNAWLMACLYDPKGNQNEQTPYISGKACSKCEAKETCKSDLCVEIPPEPKPVRQRMLPTHFPRRRQPPRHPMAARINFLSRGRPPIANRLMRRPQPRLNMGPAVHTKNNIRNLPPDLMPNGHSNRMELKDSGRNFLQESPQFTNRNKFEPTTNANYDRMGLDNRNRMALKVPHQTNLNTRPEMHYAHNAPTIKQRINQEVSKFQQPDRSVFGKEIKIPAAENNPNLPEKIVIAQNPAFSLRKNAVIDPKLSFSFNAKSENPETVNETVLEAVTDAPVLRETTTREAGEVTFPVNKVQLHSRIDPEVALKLQTEKPLTVFRKVIPPKPKKTTQPQQPKWPIHHSTGSSTSGQENWGNSQVRRFANRVGSRGRFNGRTGPSPNQNGQNPPQYFGYDSFGANPQRNMHQQHPSGVQQGFYHPSNPANRYTPQAPTTEAPMDPSCKDSDPNCNEWGIYCNKSAHVADNCPRTCKTCKRIEPVQKQPASPSYGYGARDLPPEYSHHRNMPYYHGPTYNNTHNGYAGSPYQNFNNSYQPEPYYNPHAGPGMPYQTQNYNNRPHQNTDTSINQHHNYKIDRQTVDSSRQNPIYTASQQKEMGTNYQNPNYNSASQQNTVGGNFPNHNHHTAGKQNIAGAAYQYPNYNTAPHEQTGYQTTYNNSTGNAPQTSGNTAGYDPYNYNGGPAQTTRREQMVVGKDNNHNPKYLTRKNENRQYNATNNVTNGGTWQTMDTSSLLIPNKNSAVNNIEQTPNSINQGSTEQHQKHMNAYEQGTQRTWNSPNHQENANSGKWNGPITPQDQNQRLPDSARQDSQHHWKHQQSKNRGSKQQSGNMPTTAMDPHSQHQQQPQSGEWGQNQPSGNIPTESMNKHHQHQQQHKQQSNSPSEFTRNQHSNTSHQQRGHEQWVNQQGGQGQKRHQESNLNRQESLPPRKKDIPIASSKQHKNEGTYGSPGQLKEKYIDRGMQNYNQPHKSVPQNPIQKDTGHSNVQSTVNQEIGAFNTGQIAIAKETHSMSTIRPYSTDKAFGRFNSQPSRLDTPTNKYSSGSDQHYRDPGLVSKQQAPNSKQVGMPSPDPYSSASNAFSGLRIPNNLADQNTAAGTSQSFNTGATYNYATEGNMFNTSPNPLDIFSLNSGQNQNNHHTNTGQNANTHSDPFSFPNLSFDNWLSNNPVTSSPTDTLNNFIGQSAIGGAQAQTTGQQNTRFQTSAGQGGQSNCLDYDADCPHWGQYCGNNEHVDRHCLYSCGYCHP